MKNLFTLIISLISFVAFSQSTNPESFKSGRKSSLKSDINIYYNTLLDNYDLHFVKLDLEVSDQTTYISGNAMLHLTTVANFDTLLFDLKSEMIVDSMLINDNKVSFERTSSTLKHIFDTPINQNKEIKVQIFYRGIPYEIGGGVTNKYNSQWSKSSTWTLSESFHAYEWWPCKQVLSDKIDSTYIFLTCNADCMAGSNGLLTNVVDLPESKKRYEWKTNYPMNYYLLSFAVAEYQDYSIYAKPEGVDSVLVQNFIFNSSGCLDYYKTNIDSTIDFIELFSDKFGLYPFSEEKYGHCLTSLGGGMEHQTMTTLGNFGYTLVAHELGHMWFGDYVTCASWQDIWINEGFASYLEYIALENLKTESDASNWMSNAHEIILSRQVPSSVYIPFEDANNENRIFSYAFSYKKGAAILHTLRHEINNDELFFSSIKKYLSIYADDVATGDNFKEVMETETSIDLDPFFDQWYYGKGYPRFNIEYTQLNDTLFFTVNEKTSWPTTPLFQMHVDYTIYHENGDTTLRLYQSKASETFEIPLKHKVSGVIVDPDNWIVNSSGTIDSVESLNNNTSLFSFYPNPATNNLYVDFNLKLHNEEKRIDIIDVNGRVIKTIKTQEDNIPIDVSRLSKGFYFIKVISLNNTYSYKFLKQ
ncbi:MAG: T9SS type A sorting domain-containing protein [Bacteroidales bacterium]|nr:T9SS type A sorting domain-containing protein [Bacteroidales bacterium]